MWHSSLTEEDRLTLERVQKNAFRIILQDNYKCYESAQKLLELESLFTRREKLTLRYGLKCLKLPQTRNMFPLNENTHNMKTRHTEKYKQIKAHTERFQQSTVPYLQRILNVYETEKENLSD